jgi:hypothetical protein
MNSRAYQRGIILFCHPLLEWPKAIAEAMFWGCVYFNSSFLYSFCLDFGNQGLLLTMDLAK